MKNSVKYLLLIGTCISITCQIFGVETKNLLTNGDFSAVEDNGKPSNWICEKTESIDDLIVKNKNNNYLQVPKLSTGQSWKLTTPLLDITPYNNYRLEASLKGSLFHQLEVKVNYIYKNDNKSSTVLYSISNNYTLIPDVWQRLSMDFIPPKDTKSAYIEFTWKSSGTSEKFRCGLDNACISDLGKFSLNSLHSMELAHVNPGFETGYDYKNIPGWRIWHKEQKLQVINNPAQAYKGHCFCRLPSNKRTILYMGRYNIYPPTALRVNIWSRGKGRLQFIVMIYDNISGRQFILKQKSPIFRLKADWNMYSCEFCIPLNLPEALAVGIQLDINAKEIVDIDDTKIELLTFLGTDEHELNRY
jgi:hypothetical protein